MTIKAYTAIEAIERGDLVFVYDGYARKYRPKDGIPEEIEVVHPFEGTAAARIDDEILSNCDPDKLPF